MRAGDRIVVVGDGGWGTALAMLAHARGFRVGLWSYDPEYAALMAATRSNPRYLPGFEIPAAIEVQSDLSPLALGASLVVSAVPTTYLRSVWKACRDAVPAGVPVVSVTKGLEEETLLRPSQVLEEILPGHPIAVLSGPNIAREIAEGLPAATVVASREAGLARAVQHALSGESFRVYSNPDPLGVELGGVLKNVIAIAAGMCDGLRLGANAKASLITRGVIEMARLGEQLGGKRRTFFGMSGLGDLLTTCYSPVSRNRTFGERLGRGERPEDIQASSKMVAEGAATSSPVHDLRRRLGLALPIAEQVYLVIHEGKPPQDVARSLMVRAMKDEAEDLL